MKIIQIIVSPSGKTNVETKGFAGSECVQASKFIEQAIGSRNQERKTGEFYSTAVVNNERKNSNGS